MCSDVYTDNHIMFTCQEKSDCSEKKVEGSISEIGASLERSLSKTVMDKQRSS